MFWLLAPALVWAPLLSAQAVARVPDNKPCFSYWSVGPSGCDGSKKTEDIEPEKVLPPAVAPAPAQPEVAVPAPNPELTLDQKVEKFYEQYDKPPEEFVKFHLDPTPEHALAWVNKYQEMIARQRQLSEAWQQAGEWYSILEKQGQLPEFESDLPPVPDFKEINNEMAPKSDATDGNGTLQPGTNGQITASQQAVQLTYYYERDCQACETAEQQILQYLQQNPGRYVLNCVDIAPSVIMAPTRLSCPRRPILDGEKARFGIQNVPALSIYSSGKSLVIEGDSITSGRIQAELN